MVKGRGDALIQYKWRVHEGKRTRWIVKPAIRLATGRDEAGLGAGRTGWSADLVGNYQASEEIDVIGHVRHERNRNGIGERESLWHVSAAVLFQTTEQLRLTVNVAQETHPDPGAASPTRELALGAIYELSQVVELGLGFKRGLNAPADDRAVLFAVRLRY